MKKFFAWFFGTLCVLAACLSCQDPLMPVDQPDSGTSAAKHFTATTESPATKTELSGNDTDGYVVNWQSGDKIKIVDAASTPNVGVYSTTSTAVKADFTFVSGAEATTAPYKAYYPETLYNNGTLTLPATQTYVAGNIGQSPMYAESNDESLKFKNLCGIVRLNITTNDSNRKVRKIVLSANQGMSGTFTISDNAAVIPSGTTAGVTLDCGTAGTAIGTSATAFYLAVPAASYSNLKITVVTTDGGKQTRTANKAIVVERSAMTDISLSFNGLEMDATDLSAKATANTYIVSNAGTYKFKATVKGNGGLDPVTGTTATAISTSDISGVTVLWELQARGQAIKYADNAYEVYYSDGYIYFKTPESFTPGDAYVAVFKDGTGGTAGVYDKDTDEILWSWLIWATEAPGVVEYNDYEWMDRNIGGLSGGYTGGFSYQWGRPAPFSSAYNKQYQPYTYVPARSEIFSFTNFNDGTTVEYATAHPTTFFQPPRGNWMSSAAFRNNLWSDEVKTIYDPSPIGWKVPSKTQLDGITSALTFYGTGFVGTCNTDFGYGNPGSILLWSSTCDNYSTVWANAYGSITSTQVDVYFRSGMPIRPVEDHTIVKDLSDYTDLSTNATANSYIVPAAGDYKFLATVKGNGAATLAGVNKTTNASSIAKAELVWATYGTSTAPASGALIRKIGYQDGYVYFSTGNSGYKEGNALVAIKDASNNILWSWHLWFTDDDIEGQKQTYPGGAVFMDRNLGAQSTDGVPSYGLLYQWGRKDPFLNTYFESVRYGFSNQTGNNYIEAVLGTAETRYWTSTTSDQEPTLTVAEAVGHPTYFYFAYPYNQNGRSEWAVDMTEDMWSSSKTIFDPCPPGWKVPSLSAWDDTFMSAFSDGRRPLVGDTSNGYTGLSIDIGGSTCFYPNGTFRIRPRLLWVYNSTTYYRCYGMGAIEKPVDYQFHIWAEDGLLVKSYYNGVESRNKDGKLTYDQIKSGVYGSANYPDEFCGGFSVRCVKE